MFLPGFHSSVLVFSSLSCALHVLHDRLCGGKGHVHCIFWLGILSMESLSAPIYNGSQVRQTIVGSRGLANMHRGTRKWRSRVILQNRGYLQKEGLMRVFFMDNIYSSCIQIRPRPFSISLLQRESVLRQIWFLLIYVRPQYCTPYYIYTVRFRSQYCIPYL